MIRATSVTHSHEKPDDIVELSYDDRFRRRMVMTGRNGTKFLLDLPKAVELQEGDYLTLDDGRLIKVQSADEAIMQATAGTSHLLVRIAWHVGNRHLPCEIHQKHLILRYDHVIEEMLLKLGAQVEKLTGPFNPEGGAYGFGRTHSHEH